MDINDVIRERIEAAARKAQAQKNDRARRQAARTAGLTARYAAKLQHLGLDNSTPAASAA